MGIKTFLSVLSEELRLLDLEVINSSTDKHFFFKEISIYTHQNTISAFL